MRLGGKAGDGEGLAQAAQCPLTQTRNRIVVRARRHRALVVLRLSALPVRSDDQAPCHPVRRLSPEPGAHQVQAGVHGGGGAGRGQDVTVVDVQHRLVERDMVVPNSEVVERCQCVTARRPASKPASAPGIVPRHNPEIGAPRMCAPGAPDAANRWARARRRTMRAPPQRPPCRQPRVLASSPPPWRQSSSASPPKSSQTPPARSTSPMTHASQTKNRAHNTPRTAALELGSGSRYRHMDRYPGHAAGPLKGATSAAPHR